MASINDGIDMAMTILTLAVNDDLVELHKVMTEATNDDLCRVVATLIGATQGYLEVIAEQRDITIGEALAVFGLAAAATKQRREG
jgi:hypothetical protein